MRMAFGRTTILRANSSVGSHKKLSHNIERECHVEKSASYLVRYRSLRVYCELRSNYCAQCRGE